ncbi:MAG: D-alanyl-D-alanine carboxypeptidase/D-alanyl-D-alanine-endopeptidase [Propionibacteriaceae bacterium]|nr:D-alanyl-D-alanine carboxypeptidase/D-alanyl-D-alanine-endopeptidase [Propionibacteriaceae bacterium]
MSTLPNRIVMIVLAAVLVLSGLAVGSSALGLFSGHTGALDPDSYVLPLPQASPPAPGLPPPDASLTPNSSSIEQGLNALGTGLATVSYCVTDSTGLLLANKDMNSPRIPASAWKLLTSSAILSAYGPNHQFETKVVSSAAGIILVGGGDPYLTAGSSNAPGRAKLQDLADQTAKSLIQSGNINVTLGYDDSLFAGPQWNPAWPPDWSVDVSPVSALSVDPSGDATSNTSLAAAQKFKDLLVARNINVTSVLPQTASTSATPIASVESQPLGEIVQQVLTDSYNFGAEVLFRQVAVAAGLDGSISSAQTALTTFLRVHNLWVDGMSVSDGSGLSLSDKVPPAILVDALQKANSDSTFRAILAGLPVAGVDGTLYNRFTESDAASGRGVVHAKTGTQTNVRTLTGYTQTSNGSIVFFSFMLNDLTNDNDGVNWLDRAGAILASS